jgi:hypothetical protein
MIHSTGRRARLVNRLRHFGCVGLPNDQEEARDVLIKTSIKRRQSQAIDVMTRVLRDQDPEIINHPTLAAQNLMTGAGKPLLSPQQSKKLIKDMDTCNYQCRRAILNF